MRIQLTAKGANSVSQFQSGLGSLHNRISDTIDSLQSVNNKFDDLTGGLGSLASARENLQIRLRNEEAKRDAVYQTSVRTDTFISDTVAIDNRVATIVSNSQKEFFEKYTWLRPADVNVNNESWLKKWLKETFTSMQEKLAFAWESVKNFAKTCANAIADFFKKHWKTIVISVVVIVIASAIVVGVAALVGAIAATGSTALAAAGALFKDILISAFVAAGKSALTSAVVSSIVALFSGKNIVSAFGDGLVNGFAWGAAGVALSQLVSCTFMIGKYFRPLSDGFNIKGLKVLSPNKLTSAEHGGTLIKFGNSRNSVRFDFDAGGIFRNPDGTTINDIFLHMHIPLFNNSKKIGKVATKFMEHKLVSPFLVRIQRDQYAIKLLPIISPVLTNGFGSMPVFDWIGERVFNWKNKE